MILSFPGIYSRALWVSLSPIYRYCCSHNKIMPINHNYSHPFLAQFHLQLSTLPAPQNWRWDFRIFDGGQQAEEMIPSICMKFTPLFFKSFSICVSNFQWRFVLDMPCIQDSILLTQIAFIFWKFSPIGRNTFLNHFRGVYSIILACLFHFPLITSFFFMAILGLEPPFLVSASQSMNIFLILATMLSRSGP